MAILNRTPQRPQTRTARPGSCHSQSPPGLSACHLASIRRVLTPCGSRRILAHNICNGLVRPGFVPSEKELSVAQRLEDPAVFKDRSGPLSRLFLPSIDLLDARDGVLEKLSDEDKKQLLRRRSPTSRTSRSGSTRCGITSPWRSSSRRRFGRCRSAVRGRCSSRTARRPSGSACSRRSRRSRRRSAAASSPTRLGVFTLRAARGERDDRRAIVSRGPRARCTRARRGVVTATVPVPPPGATALGADHARRGARAAAEERRRRAGRPGRGPARGNRTGVRPSQDSARPGRVQHPL